MTKIVRGNSGFGDSIYLRAAVDTFFKEEKDIKVMSNFPEVFPNYECVPYSRNAEVSYDFNYLYRKPIMGTTQWMDMIINAGMIDKKVARLKGIQDAFPFKLNIPCTQQYPKKGKLLVIVDVYSAFGNGIGENAKMTPEKDDFFNYLKHNYKDYEHKLISEKMDFQDLCNLFHSADKVFCQQGWGTALAEGLDIPCDVVFTYRALKGSYEFISQITPEKLFTKETSRAIKLP